MKNTVKHVLEKPNSNKSSKFLLKKSKNSSISFVLEEELDVNTFALPLTTVSQTQPNSTPPCYANNGDNSQSITKISISIYKNLRKPILWNKLMSKISYLQFVKLYRSSFRDLWGPGTATSVPKWSVERAPYGNLSTILLSDKEYQPIRRCF